MEIQNLGLSCTSHKTLTPEDVIMVTMESSYAQESTINPHNCNNESPTNKSPWKKFSETNIQTEPVMGTSSWPALSSRACSFEELPSSKAVITCENPDLPVSETKTIYADSVSTESPLFENASSSTVNSEISIVVCVPSSSNSEGEKAFSSSSSSPSLSPSPSSSSSLTHSGSIPFNRNDNPNCQPNHPPHRFRLHQRGNGFNVNRGNRGRHGFRNQNHTNRRQQPRPFNNWNLNPGFNPWMNPQHQQSSFLNGSAGFLGAPPLMDSYPHYVDMPPLPHHMHQIYIPPHGYYGDWYHPEAICYQPMPYVEMTGGSLLNPHSQPPNQLPPLNPPPRPPNKLLPFDHQFQRQKQMPHKEAEIYSKILNQVEYYFSTDNLVKDHHLRSECMDGEGWVHVTSIARFNKMQEIAKGDTRLILKAVRPSTIVELKGEKLRRRGDWKLWVLQPPQEMLFSGIQNMHIDGRSRAEAVESGGDLPVCSSSRKSELPNS